MEVLTKKIRPFRKAEADKLNHSVTKIYDYEDNDFPTTEEPPFAD
jgi:hypothetical protein